MDAVIGVLSVIGFIVSLALIVVFAIKKKKILPPLISLVCCFTIFVVCVALPDSSSPSPAPNTDNKQSEQTDEEKAKEMLTKASNSFEKGDYIDGISTCKSIQESYPDTNVAAGVQDFLAGKFAQYQNFSAENLMNEYINNVVNADKNITGNPVIVSGVISKIDKTDSTLAVLLSCDQVFYAIQLNFRGSDESAVAALNPGDVIKVIGKCDGLSGKILLVFDNKTNVILSNCYIID